MNKLNLNTKKRKGSAFLGFNFTPAGIAIGIIILAGLALLNDSAEQEAVFDSRLKTAQGQFGTMLSGVMDTDGYINKIVEPCSDAQTTTDLTAKRLNDCNEWKSFDIVDLDELDDDKNATASYFKIMQLNGDNRLYFDDDPLDNTAFYVYGDFNSTFHGDTIERYFGTYAKTEFPDTLQSIDWESIGLDSATGGTTTDGKFRLRFKK